MIVPPLTSDIAHAAVGWSSPPKSRLASASFFFFFFFFFFACLGHESLSFSELVRVRCALTAPSKIVAPAPAKAPPAKLSPPAMMFPSSFSAPFRLAFWSPVTRSRPERTQYLLRVPFCRWRH